MKNMKYLTYIIAVGVCITTYILLMQNIKISLLPHKALIGFLYNYDFEFVSNLGYQQSDRLFVIAKNCLGGKLFVSLFLILVFGFLHEYISTKEKIKAIAIFYISSIIIAFIATIIRISASIPFCTLPQFTLIHNTISLGIYFGTGYIVYFLMEKRRGFLCKS
ncbi:UNVERIFIED_CONTAM: exosortase K [Acetivibrio alkalicellulosi]